MIRWSDGTRALALGIGLLAVAATVPAEPKASPYWEGDTFVIRAGPVHEVLRTNTIGEPMAASPALVRGRIYIRGDSHLFAIGGRS